MKMKIDKIIIKGEEVELTPDLLDLMRKGHNNCMGSTIPINGSPCTYTEIINAMMEAMKPKSEGLMGAIRKGGNTEVYTRRLTREIMDEAMINIQEMEERNRLRRSDQNSWNYGTISEAFNEVLRIQESTGNVPYTTMTSTGGDYIVGIDPAISETPSVGYLEVELSEPNRERLRGNYESPVSPFDREAIRERINRIEDE